jgi:hypothetical protein
MVITLSSVWRSLDNLAQPHSSLSSDSHLPSYARLIIPLVVFP